MAAKKKATNTPKPKPTFLDSCDKGLFLIHQAFRPLLPAGLDVSPSAKKNFVQFQLTANPAVGLMKPTLRIKHGPGKKESFTFTLNLFVPKKPKP